MEDVTNGFIQTLFVTVVKNDYLQNAELYLHQVKLINRAFHLFTSILSSLQFLLPSSTLL